jgi:hypothetical protein
MKIPKKTPRDPNQLAKLIVDLSTADEPPLPAAPKKAAKAIKKKPPTREKKP